MAKHPTSTAPKRTTSIAEWLDRDVTLAGVSFNPHLTLLVIVTTIVPMLDHYGYEPIGIQSYDRFLYYFVIPLLLIVLLFRARPTAYGLQLGDWRRGVPITLLAIVIMGVALYLLAQTPAMQAYYAARARPTLGAILWHSGVELWAWEFVWRGFLLFGLARHVGPGAAIWLQAVPFAFMHLDKPAIETLTTIFGGAAFGLLAWRTRSFLYAFVIHWFMVAFTYIVASGRL